MILNLLLHESRIKRFCLFHYIWGLCLVREDVNATTICLAKSNFNTPAVCRCYYYCVTTKSSVQLLFLAIYHYYHCYFHILTKIILMFASPFFFLLGIVTRANGCPNLRGGTSLRFGRQISRFGRGDSDGDHVIPKQ